MARPTKHAPTITIITGIAAALGPAPPLTRQPSGRWGLLPATVYEVYRTEGRAPAGPPGCYWGCCSSRGRSWFGVDADLATFLGRDSQTVAGYDVPLGPVTVVGPVVMAVVCLILISQTRGRYTKALAGIILVGAAAALYIIDPGILGQWLGAALDRL